MRRRRGWMLLYTIVLVGLFLLWEMSGVVRTSRQEALFLLRHKNLVPSQRHATHRFQDNRESEEDLVELIVFVFGDGSTSSPSRRRWIREVIRYDGPSRVSILTRFVVQVHSEEAKVVVEGEDDVIVCMGSSRAEKIKTSFTWAAREHPGSKYVAIVRDSSVFWPTRILREAKKRLKPYEDLFVMGNIMHLEPRAKKDVKWIPAEYPAFPHDDSGFVVTMSICQHITSNALHLVNYLPSEGVSLGVWLSGLRVKWIHHEELFRLDQNCPREAAVVAGPFLSLEGMVTCKVEGKLGHFQKKPSSGLLQWMLSSLRLGRVRMNEDPTDVRLAIPGKLLLGKDWNAPDAHNKADLVILVLSARTYTDRRRDVRAMLAAQGPLQNNIVLRFVVGEGPKKIEQADDVIVMPLEDHYSRLPAKLKYGYMWVEANHPEAGFVLKCDDDQVFWPARVLQYLKSFSPSDKLVLGGIRSDLVSRRDGKWAEHLRWEPNRYPSFPMGSFGHIVSRPLYSYIAANEDILYEFQGEDSCLSIWTACFDVRFHNLTGDFMRNNRTCEGRPLVVGHDMVGIQTLLDCVQLSRQP